MGKTLDKILKEMKINKIDVDIDQKNLFELLKDIHRNINQYFKTDSLLTEEKFYINLINKEYAINQHIENIDKCHKEGHIEGTMMSANGHKKSYICNRCKLPYDRIYTTEEKIEYLKMMRTPMDI